MDSRPSGPERWISVVDKPPVWSAASAGASAQAKVTCVPRRPRRLVRLLGSEVSWATSRLWGPAANQTGVWLRLFPFVFHSGTPSERRLSYVCERTNAPIGEPASNPRPPPTPPPPALAMVLRFRWPGVVSSWLVCSDTGRAGCTCV